MAASAGKLPQEGAKRPFPKAKSPSANSVLNSIATSYYRLCGLPFTSLRRSAVLPRRRTWERHSKEIERIVGQTQDWEMDGEETGFVEPRIHARFSARKIPPKVTPRRGPASARLLTPLQFPQKEYYEGLSIAPLVAVSQRHGNQLRSRTRLSPPKRTANVND